MQTWMCWWVLALTACTSPLAASDPDASTTDDLAWADGTPVRQACTRRLGNGLSAAFGRLDGFLVAVEPPGVSCGSSTHLQLQIRMAGSIYDVATTMVDNNGADVFYLARDLAMPDGAWSEGWHTGISLDYPTLGLHAQDFTSTPETALSTEVIAQLQNANHISVFMTGYDATGGHNVHRNGNGNDGAIVIDPGAPTSHMLFFHFATQTF